MKKTAILIAAATLFASQAFAQTPPGPTDGSNKSPALPMGSAAKPVGEGSGMAPAKADAPGKEARTARNAANKEARTAKRAQMKDANKGGEIPSPSVNPKSY